MQNRIKSEQSNDEVVQKQSAGENSNQVQVGTVVVNQGITEERARNVFAEMIPQALKEYSNEAVNVANERIGRLESIVMPRIMEIDDALSSFADPAFQLLLRKAQQSAATTERKDDYSLLSELIVCQIQKGADRKNRAGINKAIEIISDIDSDSLCALTVAHAVGFYSPISGDVEEGLGALNSLFEKILYNGLPTGHDWLDHLDVLGALRISQFTTLKSIKEYYSENLNGYVCAGIKEGTAEYKEAINMLQLSRLSTHLLQPNKLLEGYVRLPITAERLICDLVIIDGSISRAISDAERETLEKIWNMYSRDDSLIQIAKDNFIKMWDAYDALKRVRLWWEAIPQAFSITKVGTILAHTNAKRCDSSLPDLL